VSVKNTFVMCSVFVQILLLYIGNDEGAHLAFEYIPNQYSDHLWREDLFGEIVIYESLRTFGVETSNKEFVLI
jgi:hypothetical protein